MEKLLPQLRFPGFEGEWEEKKLGDLLEFKNGINATKEQYGRGVKFINVLDILNNDFITHDKIIGSVDVEQSIADKFSVNYGDILFQRSSETREEVGTACVYLDKDTSSTFGGFVIRGKKIGEYEPIFLNKLLKTNLSRDAITSRSGGSTRYNIGQEILNSIVLPFPSIPEQTKIATFLTEVDKKLTALKQKKILLEQYKKGVMQQIFTQQLRFKDDNGNDFPDWEEKKLGEIGNIITGKTPSTTNLDLWDGEIQFVTPTDIDDSKYQYTSVRTVKKTDKLKILPPKSIMFTCIASIGKMSISIYPSITNQQINSIIPFEYYDNEFIYYSLLNITDFIKSTPSSSTLPLINKTEFSKFIIQIPSIEEQTKIANFLSAIDEKINHCQGQIEKTQVWKKGLLQQLFV
ncbi:restriction endonuclease subunit S [Flavobacterium sp. GP15]|uniref:restriction endonuclease subunit S n=1 Tax=Flavobacterium sp. GP15 TaxID=2758567 RepID=UPI00165D71BA|nr:restriction endonuclease subunit S [Flavobacterium sp. GP15]